MKKILAFFILLIGMISGTGYATDVGDLRQNSNDENRFAALFAEADAQFNIVNSVYLKESRSERIERLRMRAIKIRSQFEVEYAVELKELKSSIAKQLFYPPDTNRIKKQDLHNDLRQNSNGENRFAALFAEADAQFNIEYAVELKELKSSIAKQLFFPPDINRIKKQDLHKGEKVYIRSEDPSIKKKYGRLPRDGLRKNKRS